MLAAVSGGADSTALLCLLHELRDRLGIARLGVLHLNHGLRGSESDGDERFVADLANRLDIDKSTASRLLVSTAALRTGWNLTLRVVSALVSR